MTNWDNQDERESAIAAKWAEAEDKVKVLREALLSFTKSAYIKKQHPIRFAKAIAALVENQPRSGVVCHASGDRCRGCDHYNGLTPQCEFAPAAVPLLTDAQVDAISMGLFGCINAAYRKQITDAVLSSGGGGITCATKRTVAQVRTATSAAPAAVPLTDEQILEIAEPFGCFQYGDAQGHKRIEFARAVLAAAGDKS